LENTLLRGTRPTAGRSIAVVVVVVAVVDVDGGGNVLNFTRAIKIGDTMYIKDLVHLYQLNLTMVVWFWF